MPLENFILIKRREIIAQNGDPRAAHAQSLLLVVSNFPRA